MNVSAMLNQFPEHCHIIRTDISLVAKEMEWSASLVVGVVDISAMVEEIIAKLK
jgi:hypothetical protein